MNIREMREDVLQTSKKCYQEALFAATSGNLSVYDAGAGLMAITPSGVAYDTMKPEDIMVIDLDGRIIEGMLRPSSEWRLHACIYRHFPEVKAVVHTHSPFATGFAVNGKRIPATLAEMIPFLGGDVPVAPYQTPGTDELGMEAVKAMEKRKGCLLANHGVVAIGEDLTIAHKRAVYVEDAAKVCTYGQINGAVHELSREEQNQIRRRKGMPEE